MIRKVHIQNFKSLADFEMELGRVNVIIGANGSGKTNILEGIAMGAAAAADKLEYEFLGARLRVTAPEFMKCAFVQKRNKEILIEISAIGLISSLRFRLIPNKDDHRKWMDIEQETIRDQVWELYAGLLNGDSEFLSQVPDNLKWFLEALDQMKEENDRDAIVRHLYASTMATRQIHRVGDVDLAEFLIYSPENYLLRKFEEPSQITPLGINGQGLFHELKRITGSKKHKKQLGEIRDHLHLLDWFDDFEIPGDLMSMEYKIAIKDRFLDPKLAAFDQRSANEGFLMLLFYLVLFTSENTPNFFAIENIDTAFNPKMCSEIMGLIARLAKKHSKQVIVTTHNSSTLNGLNLKDDEQRLFVARRNKKGHTQVERITQKADSNLMLSEIWTRGYFGGLPDNF
jgi:energy-coupling factor transporter ATP-binding protein EcfA2